MPGDPAQLRDAHGPIPPVVLQGRGPHCKPRAMGRHQSGGAGALTSTLPVPALRGSDPIPGARTASPHPSQSWYLPPSVPCQTFQPQLRAGPRGRRPSTPCRARPGPRVGGGRAGGGERAWAAPGPGRRSPGWLQSLRKMVPSPPPGTVNQRPPFPGARGARASRRGRTHLPAATCARREPRGKLCGPPGGGGRRCPLMPGRSPPPSPARPLTFHGGEQRQQQQRGPQPPQGHGCASRGLGPRRRGARAARAGARAPGSGGRGERRGAAHRQPPPPRSQQNEPSSPGRTGTRAPPALGAAHLSRGRGGIPAGPPLPARARDPSCPRALLEPQPPASSGPPGGLAGAGARTCRALRRLRRRAPPAQQWSLPALWLLQIKQRFQPKCF